MDMQYGLAHLAGIIKEYRYIEKAANLDKDDKDDYLIIILRKVDIVRLCLSIRENHSAIK